VTMKEEEKSYFRYVGMYDKQYKSLLVHTEVNAVTETITDDMDWFQSLKSPELEVKDWIDYVEKSAREILINLGLPDDQKELYQIVKEYKSGPEWHLHTILLQLSITKHAMGKGDLFTSVLEAMRLQQAVDNLRFCHFEKYIVTAMEERKGRQRGGGIETASKGITQAIKNIKEQAPDIKAKECWSRLVKLAEDDAMIICDGIKYVLGINNPDGTDLNKIQIVSVNDSTGDADGKGIGLGRLQNKFSKI
jgi:hypothetical protein